MLKRILALVIVIAAGFIVGVSISNPAGHSARPASDSVTVSSFNDGFATSKQDDCSQGFTAACEWLKQNGLSK